MTLHTNQKQRQIPVVITITGTMARIWPTPMCPPKIRTRRQLRISGRFCVILIRPHRQLIFIYQRMDSSVIRQVRAPTIACLNLCVFTTFFVSHCYRQWICTFYCEACQPQSDRINVRDQCIDGHLWLGNPTDEHKWIHWHLSIGYRDKRMLPSMVVAKLHSIVIQ